MRLHLLIFLLLALKTQAQLHTYKIFNHRNGLSVSTVWSLMQNPDGGIIVGTEGAGLFEYDGYNFTQIGIDQSNSNYHVSSVINHKGNMLFTDLYKGLYKITSSNQIKQIDFNSPENGFEKVVAVNNTLFLFHSSGITRIWDKSSKRILKFSKPTERLIIHNCISFPGGEIILSNKGNYFISATAETIVDLSVYLNQTEDWVKNIHFGYFSDNQLRFFTKNLSQEYSCSINHSNVVGNISSKTNDPIPGNFIIQKGVFNKVRNSFAVVNGNGEIIEITNEKQKKIDFNLKTELGGIRVLLADYNGDYWMGSQSNGLIKVSIEPFTKLTFHEQYNENNIGFCFKTNNGKLITSSDRNVSYYGELNSGKLKSIPKGIISATYHKNKLYCGTSNGLSIFNEETNSIVNYNHPEINNTLPIRFVFSDSVNLWISQENEGLLKLNPETRLFKRYSINDSNSSGHNYTGQLSFDGKSLFVGGNGGIYRYSLVDNKVDRLPIQDMGSYCGSSTKDIFGTVWFTIDNGIIGILKNGEIVQISDTKYFPSKLFYTLNSDRYANLIIGSNKGLNFIKVNEEGKVLKQSTYDEKSGFEGFETNSRADFQGNNEIIIGTIEGLFQINPSVLQMMAAPTPPLIHLKNQKDNSENAKLQFSIRSKNPKTKLIYYSYRIVELNEVWSELSTTPLFTIEDLSNGDYTLEIRSTYNGIEFSDIQSKKFLIHQPYYKAPWFIFFVVFSILLINILILLKINKAEDRSKFLSEEYFSLQKIVPNLILFAALANTIAEIIVSNFNNEIQTNLPYAITIGFVLLSQYFIAINNKLNNQIRKLRLNLIIAFIIILGYSVLMMYKFNLHPYYTSSILIIVSVTPFLFDNLKHVSIFGIAYVFVCSAIALTVKDPIVNPHLFILSIITSALLLILLTHLRNNSIFKLAFVSAIVNKGNIPAIAFNKEGTITFASKNINRFIGVSDDKLINQSILSLNHYVAKNGTQTEQDISNLFKNEPIQTFPMYNLQGEMTWIEWTYKSFSDDVKVIIGQVVNDKIMVQNTYELLVQNAEDYIYQVNNDSSFQFVNARFYDRLGYSKSELIGRSSLDLVQDNYKDIVEEFYNNHFKNKEKHTYLEFPIKRKDGSVIWLGQHVSTLFQPGSTTMIIGFLALARDITIKREQEKTIAEQNTNITSSINYAQRIQQNLMPSESTMKMIFEESFVIFKPKDIVSGDFYWTKQIGQSIIMVVGDSTGHGVPGAFMSLLGINLLNSIIHENQLLNPGKILDEIDFKLREALPRKIDGNVVNDGMEMTMCIINTKNDTMLYACAGSKILMHNGNSFNLYKGDYKHIGDERTDEFSGYVTHHATFDNNSTLYLFTDGFQDQFGGRKEKKFSIRRLLEMFEENIRLPLTEQSKMITKEFDIWKGEESQTDDVTIIGIRKKTK